MQKIFKNPLFWIFIFAFILRIYKLDAFPFGLHIDEIRIGWNAFSILKTGLNDHRELLTLYYNTFGDFRPSGIFYLTIPSLIIFGPNIFAIRFPAAVIGALTVFPLYLLVNAFSKNKKISHGLNAGHFAAILFAISPWEIEVGRATSESVISMFFGLYAIYYFIKMIEERKTRLFTNILIFLTAGELFYHSIRLLAPFFILAIALFYYKKSLSKGLRKVVIAVFIFSGTLAFLFNLSTGGVARLSQVSIIKDVDVVYELNRLRAENNKPNLLTFIFDNKEVVYVKSFILQYTNYFDANFLLGYGAKPYRYATPGTGLLNYIEIVFLLFGLIQVASGKKSYLPLVLLAISPLAAAITSEDAPNLQRALFMSPFLLIIEAYGLEKIFENFRKYKKMAIFITSSLVLISSIYFFYMYFDHSWNHRPFYKDIFIDSPSFRNVGAIDLVKELDSLSPRYEKIIVTNFPDNLYPYYAFFTGKEPGEFNKTYSSSSGQRVWGNIIFSNDKCPSDDELEINYNKNILLIDSWECGYESQITAGSPMKILSKIARPDGSEVYILLERDWSKDFPPNVLERIRQNLKK